MKTDNFQNLAPGWQDTTGAKEAQATRFQWSGPDHSTFIWYQFDLGGLRWYHDEGGKDDYENDDGKDDDGNAMATSPHPTTTNNNKISPRTTRQSCCWPNLHIGLLPPWAEVGDHLDEKNVHDDDIDEIGKGIVIIMVMMKLPIRKYDDDDEESTQSSVLPTHDRLPPANWPFRGAFLGKGSNEDLDEDYDENHDEDHDGVLLPVELIWGIRGNVNSPLHRREDGLHPRITWRKQHSFTQSLTGVKNVTS